jgi:uncharacterized membrane protein YfcA
MVGLQEILSVASGSLVGFTLGLIGGGGSILAVPLLIYVVGISSPHHAIGTSAVAVAASAAFNLVGHARADTVKWRCALVFAASGVLGALLGAALGKAVDGQKLLALFGLLMIAVGGFMLVRRKGGGDPDVHLSWATARSLMPSLVGYGLLVGALSGFFGIGGGFLVVPGLVGATAMPLLNAIGSSLVSVTAFGATTAASYAFSGLVDWTVAGLFVAGGAAGGAVGILAARRLAQHKNLLSRIFAAIVIAVGAYVVFKGADSLLDWI